MQWPFSSFLCIVPCWGGHYQHAKTGELNEGPLTADKILVTAPYNGQVNRLQQRLNGRARVGTVDELQGQEAPVAIHSLTASSGDDAHRGLSFLLQPKLVKLGQCGFNFQGITRDRKRALGTGDPNTVLIELDWSSIEIRLQASSKLYNNDGQRKILLDGIDPHAYIASQACATKSVLSTLH